MIFGFRTDLNKLGVPFLWLFLLLIAPSNLCAEFVLKSSSSTQHQSSFTTFTTNQLATKQPTHESNGFFDSFNKDLSISIVAKIWLRFVRMNILCVFLAALDRDCRLTNKHLPPRRQFWINLGFNTMLYKVGRASNSPLEPACSLNA